MKPYRLIKLLSCVALFVLVSCNKGHNDDGIVYIPECKNELKTSDFVKGIEWIALEDTVDGFINSVSRIIEYNDEIYILEKGFQNCVIVFDEHGKYQRRIGRKGGGEGEYPTTIDFTIEEESGNVTILSLNSKVYKYDNQGKFLVSKQLDEVQLLNITHTRHGYVATTNHGTYTGENGADLIYWFDDDFNFIGKAVKELDQQLALPFFIDQLKTVDGEAYYCDVYTHTVYRCSSYDDYEAVIRYEYPNPMPLDSYFDTAFFDNQNLYDSTFGIINLSDCAIIMSFMSGTFGVAVVTYDGQLKKNGAAGIPAQNYTGAGNTILSPIDLSLYFKFGDRYTDVRPAKEPTDEDNLLLLRWKLAE